jgi:magnesium-transporting ATPase (P-type)
MGHVAILVVVFETAFSEWRLKREFRRVQDEFDNQRASVVRDNRIQEIPAKELVVGGKNDE